MQGNTGRAELRRRHVRATHASGAPLRGVPLGRVSGVQLSASFSLLALMGLLTVGLAVFALPRWRPDWSPLEVWAAAAAAAVAFFASVLLQQLAHALMALLLGVRVRRLELFVFGGRAEHQREPSSPLTEFLVALAGPLTSAVIAVTALNFGLDWAGAPLARALTSEDAATSAEALRQVEPAALLAIWLGPTNVALALFNLVPVLPLDGGRLLRASIWGATRSFETATRWAMRAGRAFAYLLMAAGAVSMLAGALLGGLWLLLLGWFASNTARLSYEQTLVRRALHDVPVQRVMRTRVMRVPHDLTIDRFVRDYLMQTEQRAFPVEQDGSLLGILRLSDVRALRSSEWSRTTAAQVMTSASDLPALPPDAAAEEALEALTERGLEQLPVIERDHFVGLVSRGDLVKWLALRSTNEPALDSSRMR